MVSVLVVDDDVSLADGVADCLREAGYVTRVVYGAAAAVQSYSAAPPDVLLTDFMMPGMTGGQLIVRLRPLARAGACFILMSSSSERFIREASRAHDAFLRKPFTPDELYAMVEACLPWKRNTGSAGSSRDGSPNENPPT